METLPCSPDLEASCALCRDDVFHCHEVSVVYLDGATACGDPWCTLPHHLHEWHETESTAPPPVSFGTAYAAGLRYTDTWLSLAS